MKHFINILVCATMILFSYTALRAMNWEGHDDWLESQSHGQELRNHFPKPLLRQYSSCEEVRARLKDNPYEQRPIPGKNCFEAELGNHDIELD